MKVSRAKIKTRGTVFRATKKSVMNGKGVDSDISMVIKLTGILPKAMSGLHAKVDSDEAFKPARPYKDRNRGQAQIVLVKILSAKFIEEYQTYTVELEVTVKRASVMVTEDKAGKTIPATSFGQFFTSMLVIDMLFEILSAGQKESLFPTEEAFVPVE